MATIVIGGQASGVGKTGVVCALMTAIPERRWTAIKITQCNHEGGEKLCDCELDGREFAVTEERDRAAHTDSARYLAAGAKRSLWVRTLPGHLAEAMPVVREAMADTEDVIFESNSALEFIEPDVYALIVSPCAGDFKPSARRYLERADAILMATPPPDLARQAWMVELKKQLDRLPQFAIVQSKLAPEFVAFVRSRMNE
jgi:hypothetical protein